MTERAAFPHLDGYEIHGLAAAGIKETQEELAHVQRTAGGLARRQGRFWGAGWPDRRIAHRWEVDYRNLRERRRLLAALRSRPGTHAWTLWRRVELSYAGDNVRTEFTLPWPHAPYVAELPSTDPGGVDLGFEAALSPAFDVPLTVVPQTTAAYDGGSPAAGELWVDSEGGGRRCKVEAALAYGEVLYVSMVPLFTVLMDPAPTPQELQMGRAAARIVLVEAAVP